MRLFKTRVVATLSSLAFGVLASARFIRASPCAAAFFKIEKPDNVPETLQDRAYTSPIWCTPLRVGNGNLSKPSSP